MNSALTPLRQLVDRKLWPVALLLVGALAAVPMLLGKDEAPAPVAPVAVTANVAAAQSPTQPIVTLGQPAERERQRKVLGARKNPFAPAVKAKAASETPSTAPSGSTVSGGVTPSKPGGTEAPTVLPPAPTVPSNPTRPALKLYDMYAAKIRFGESSEETLRTRALRRLAPLPGKDDARVLFLGLKRDHKTAVFLLAANTRAVGEGECLPARTNCLTVELKAGETEFIDVLDAAGQVQAQYQLDMVRVLRGVTIDPKVERRWRHTIARGGREALRETVSRINGWKYDVDKGVVHRRVDD